MLVETLTRKLRIQTNLDNDDIKAIEALTIIPKNLTAGDPVAREGDRPGHCCLVLEGVLIRSKTSDSGRQILSIHIPGDIPDLQSLHLHVMDHDMMALSDSKIGYIPHDTLRQLTRSRPLVAEALWRETLVDAAIFREWIVNVGRRNSTQRMAHFFVEIKSRLSLVGLGDRTIRLPMTQQDLADSLGISSVHVNRTLKALRAENLVEFRNGDLTINDLDRLIEIADFDGLYLHQRPEL